MYGQSVLLLYAEGLDLARHQTASSAGLLVHVNPAGETLKLTAACLLRGLWCPPKVQHGLTILQVPHGLVQRLFPLVHTTGCTAVHTNGQALAVSTGNSEITTVVRILDTLCSIHSSRL